MDESQQPKKRLDDSVSFFTGVEGDQSLTKEELLLSPGHSLPRRLALWMEYFLEGGEERFKRVWVHLPPEEREALGFEILKCYLSQPLFIRLSPEERWAGKKTRSISKGKEHLLQVTVQDGETSEIHSFYPLAHQRLWPAMLNDLKEEFFTSEKILKRLQPALTMTSSSRLEAIRKRADTLITFFSQGLKGSLPPVFQTDRPAIPEEGSLEMPEAIPVGKTGFSSTSEEEPNRPIPEGTEDPPSTPSLLPKKKKKKSSNDQLKLF